jgi:DNA-binding MarR family transcriptional regulator
MPRPTSARHLNLVKQMDIPKLPPPLRRTPVNAAANLCEAILVQATRGMRTVESETGLSPERLDLLAELLTSGPQPVGHLAWRLRVSAAAVSKMVTDLEGAGLVRRSGDADDARRVLVRTTAAGRRAMERGRANRIRSWAAELRTLNERELAQLERGLRVLARVVE